MTSSCLVQPDCFSPDDQYPVFGSDVVSVGLSSKPGQAEYHFSQELAVFLAVTLL